MSVLIYDLFLVHIEPYFYTRLGKYSISLIEAIAFSIFEQTKHPLNITSRPREYCFLGFVFFFPFVFQQKLFSST